MKLILMLILFSGCSYFSISNQKKNLVSFDQDVVIFQDGKKERKVKKGEEVAIGNGFLYARKSFHKDFFLYIMPPEKTGEVKVSRIRSNKEYDDTSFETFNTVLPEIFKSISRVELFIEKKEFSKASEVLSGIIKKYPDLSYLRVLHANVLYQSGLLNRAQEELELASKDFPNNLDIKNLLDLVKGNNTANREVSSDNEN